MDRPMIAAMAASTMAVTRMRSCGVRATVCVVAPVPKRSQSGAKWMSESASRAYWRMSASGCDFGGGSAKDSAMCQLICVPDFRWHVAQSNGMLDRWAAISIRPDGPTALGSMTGKRFPHGYHAGTSAETKLRSLVLLEMSRNTTLAPAYGAWRSSPASSRNSGARSSRPAPPSAPSCAAGAAAQLPT